MADEILKLINLTAHFESRAGRVHAVDEVNITIRKREILGLIGETGCGKSVLGQSILRLLPRNALITGEALLEGKDILKMNKRELLSVRGRQVAYICQNPAEALNPVVKNGKQLLESVRINSALHGDKAEQFSLDLLQKLRFDDPQRCMRTYPHQLSGGMKQRVLAAMGMSGNPALLIADEPTKGLDSMIREQVTETIRTFAKVTGSAALIITHDLKFAASICNRLAVMYAGEIVESGEIGSLFTAPRHPYLKALIAAQPQNGMHVLRGSSCSLIDLPAHCRFYERCDAATPGCMKSRPQTTCAEAGHEVRCFRYA
jgi:peptide/nickel transport system ATP-binding protein